VVVGGVRGDGRAAGAEVDVGAGDLVQDVGHVLGAALGVRALPVLVAAEQVDDRLPREDVLLLVVHRDRVADPVLDLRRQSVCGRDAFHESRCGELHLRS
jgi:hypothetical protein